MSIDPAGFLSAIALGDDAVLIIYRNCRRFFLTWARLLLYSTPSCKPIIQLPPKDGPACAPPPLAVAVEAAKGAVFTASDIPKPQ
jgi:hypothetical protein